MSNLKIALAQINTIVGDVNGNSQKIISILKKADEENCDLVIFPESSICGYPCDDLWNKKYFILNIEEKIREICKATMGLKCAILFGSPAFEITKKKEVLYNCAFLIEDGLVKKIAHKKSLPNYGVFDEKRYFESGSFLSNVEFRGQTIALLICEDLWDNKNLFLLQEQVFDLAISINASPYQSNKQQARFDVASNFAKSLNKPLIYVNQIGGQDSLVFDGSSFAIDNQGSIALMMKSFAEDFAILEIAKNGEVNDMNIRTGLQTPSSNKPFISCQNDYQAAVLGLRDYIKKNNFQKVLLGMSGGIDSALVATIAVDALGKENVLLYALPSRYNSSQSMIDAKECAKNLENKLQEISIEPAFKAMLEMLKSEKGSDPFSGSFLLMQENLQSRIRGNILMAISNDTGALLLSTGNKSELAMGYATIYGDMCGAFNPIKDLYKTKIYELANWRNQNIPPISLYQKTNLIPHNIITKAPTAELRENQKDSDSLPEYEILDKILYQLIEEEKSVANIIESGFDEELVKKIAKSFYLSEYKRKQAVIGPKISSKSFDKERRYPITNKFCQ